MTFAQFLLDLIRELWPLVQVHQWQAGARMRWGRFVKVLPPGTYVRCPFFASILTADMVPFTPLSSTIETITTRDGKTLTYGWIGEFEVFDAQRALMTVMDHEDKARRDSWGVIAGVIASLPEGRLDEEKQASLVRLCVRRINEQLERYGMRCLNVWFTTYVKDMRAYRLFTGE